MDKELRERVRDFQMLRLPGQPLMMHMGTSYLVNDLQSRILALEKALQPFANYADSRNVVNPEFIITAGSSIAKKQLTMGDCYRAWHVLNGTKT